jgi:hypothetical protein
MTVKTLNRSFAGGEISPQLFSRLDLDKFQTGLALCLNCEVQPQGPIQNRAGFGYVLETKFSDQVSVLIPFTFSTEQTFVLEFGFLYVRFHTNGGTLLEAPIAIASIQQAVDPIVTLFTPHDWQPGDWVYLDNIGGMTELSGRWLQVYDVIDTMHVKLSDLWDQPLDTSAMPSYTFGGTMARVYEVQTPYVSDDLRALKYVQSADVLTLVHPGHSPAELRRFGATNWSLSEIVFANVPVTVNNDLNVPGRFNRVSWNPQTSAVAYWVWKIVGGTPGYIGQTPSGNFLDDYGQPPDTSVVFPGPVVLAALTVSANAIAPAGTGLIVTPSGAGAITYAYVVTSVTEDGTEESIASPSVSVSNDLNISGNKNTLTWPAVPGVSRYHVYRLRSGAYSFIGIADQGLTFVDDNISPDVTVTPPQLLNPFVGAGNFPRAVTYFQQRRVFASTVNDPQRVWMTRSGTEKNFSYSLPSQDDDSVVLRVVSREANTIRAMVPMADLILLTSGGEWKLGSGDGNAVTPSSVNVSPQGYTGTADVQPVTADRTILYPVDRGGYIRELEFSWEQQGYQTSNVSILAPHLFDYYTVVQLAFSRSPLSTLWSVRNDGRLLGMTYVPEHEVRAWHQHITDGQFESVCCVAEGDEDVVYVIARRQVNGRSVRYVERKHTRRFDTPADQFFVDSGVSFATSGAPVSTISGLYHLEGKTVSILADAGVVPPQVVVGGRVTLDSPASKVHIGLPYTAQIKTLPLSVQTQAYGQGIVKNVNKVQLRVYSSSGFKAGPSFDKLRPYPARSFEPWGSPPDLVTGEVPLTLDPSWQRDGAVCLQQDVPVSFTLLGMVLETATGG